MTEGTQDRRRDDWIKLPKPIIIALIIAAAVASPSALYFLGGYVTGRDDKVVSLETQISGVDKKVGELQTTMHARDVTLDARADRQEERERADADRLTKIEAGLSYLIHTREVESDPTPMPGGGSPRKIR